MLESKQESDKTKAVFSEFKGSIKAGEMEQLVKTRAIKPGDPSLFPRTYLEVEAEN